MGDLMTDSFSYNTLSNKYGNFVVPLLKLKVMGTDMVKALNLKITEVQIELSLTGAGSVTIHLMDAYEIKSHSFNSKIKSIFKLGTIVEVEIGYLSATQKIFKGYVAMAGVEVRPLYRYTIILMDARRLMMQSGTKKVLHDVKNYSDAFKNVMKSYSMLCSTQIDATSDQLKMPVSQTTNDYEFITKELIASGRTQREFFIFAGKAYFRKVHRNKTPVLTVKPGRELLEFSSMQEFMDLSIEVIGYNNSQQATFTATSNAKSNGEQSSLFLKKPVYTITAPSADSQSKANTLAQSMAEDAIDSTCIGTAVLRGMPELIPGRYMKVEDLDKDTDKNYYVTDVKHIMDDRYFRTYATIRGCQ